MTPILPSGMPHLPRSATAPFCPSEVQGGVALDPKASFWRNLLRAAGPGLLVAVGYMDPGNWATDIAAGSQFGYSLLFVVALSSLAAIVLQCIAARLGIATGHDLAQLCASQYGKGSRMFLWLMAEISIIACDLAEVLGGALAFHLLLGVPLMGGLALTILDTFIVLGLKGRNFRTLEAIILGLIITIGVCFAVEIFWTAPYWPAVFAGLIPTQKTFSTPNAMELAIGILGATVMPHNLYLHSSIVGTRNMVGQPRTMLKLYTIDTVASLTIAFFINAAILILAGGTFFVAGQAVSDIGDAYHLLEPILGVGTAALVFGVALLASGQSSTFTGTIAGQVILEAFVKLKLPCWQRRIITRALALLPAFIGIALLGGAGIGKMLVWSQVVLGLQLPFALYPMLRMAANRTLMGELTMNPIWRVAGWVIFAIICAGNLWMLYGLI